MISGSATVAAVPARNFLREIVWLDAMFDSPPFRIRRFDIARASPSLLHSAMASPETLLRSETWLKYPLEGFDMTSTIRSVRLHGPNDLRLGQDQCRPLPLARFY